MDLPCSSSGSTSNQPSRSSRRLKRKRESLDYNWMEDLVDVLGQVRGAVGRFSLTMRAPQFVVVGSQGVGKSSVLEHIVGKPFLPKGAGIVTRCPLLIELVHSPNVTEEYAVFEHDSTKHFTNYDLIREEITKQTEKLAGPNKGIYLGAISLKIYSSSVLNMILVDMPGLIKAPVGDQPHDIETHTRNFIRRNPSSFILAVASADDDFATSEGWKMVKELDPQGKRTIPLITKLDLMGPGTVAWNQVVQRTPIGVVNRSQKDIDEGKSVEESLHDEAEFLQSNYKSVSAKNGSLHLKKTVRDIYASHIKGFVQGTKQVIGQKLTNQKAELALCTKSKLDNPTLFSFRVFEFTNLFKGHVTNIQTGDLNSGARIQNIFQDQFAKTIRSVDPLAGLNETEIITSVKNSIGMNPAMFVPEGAFEYLVKKQLEQFRGPSLKCVELIYLEMNRIAQTCLEDKSSQLDLHPKLKTTIGEVVKKLLMDRLQITMDSVKSIIDIQVARINTSHPDFQSALSQSFRSKKHKSKYYESPNQARTSQTLLFIEANVESGGNVSSDLVEELITVYMSIVGKIVEDTVPKIIMHYLVNFIVNNLQAELFKQIHGELSRDKNLMNEPQATTNKRNELNAVIARLEEIQRIMDNLSFLINMKFNKSFLRT